MIKPKRVIIVAGVSCSGKSTVIRALKSGVLPTSGIDISGFDSMDCKVMRVKDLFEADQPRTLDRLIVHYDLTAQDRGTGLFPFLNELAEVADTTTVITVVVPTSVLYQRNLKRLKSNLWRIPSRRYISTIKYRFRVLKRARDSHVISGIYERWIERTASVGVTDHWLVDASASVPKEPEPKIDERIHRILAT